MRQEAVGQEVPASRPRPRTPGRRKRSAAVVCFQLVIVIFVVGAVAGGLYQLTVEQADQALAVPGRIGGYSLTDVVRGADAVAELRQLHGKDVGLSGGWIGHYQNNGVAWVGTVASEERAAQLIEAMNRRISAGNGPFGDLEELTIDGRTVYTVTGQGQRHYYYQQGKLTVWLAAPKGGEERFLKDALTVIR